MSDYIKFLIIVIFLSLFIPWIDQQTGFSHIFQTTTFFQRMVHNGLYMIFGFLIGKQWKDNII